MKEPVITFTLEEYEELRKERERLEKEHAELQRKYAASLQEYSRQVEEISACTAVIADLRWKLADLTRRLWGKSSTDPPAAPVGLGWFRSFGKASGSHPRPCPTGSGRRCDRILWLRGSRRDCK